MDVDNNTVGIQRQAKRFGRVIVMESILSFLGLGVQPPIPSWGNLLYGAQNYLATESWLATFPGMFIFLAVLGVNLVGDGLRESLLPGSTIR